MKLHVNVGQPGGPEWSVVPESREDVEALLAIVGDRVTVAVRGAALPVDDGAGAVLHVYDHGALPPSRPREHHLRVMADLSFEARVGGELVASGTILAGPGVLDQVLDFARGADVEADLPPELTPGDVDPDPALAWVALLPRSERPRGPQGIEALHRLQADILAGRGRGLQVREAWRARQERDERERQVLRPAAQVPEPAPVRERLSERALRFVLGS